jgi:MarR family transcriptional regulator, organic hydroperoxide resistance regulator
MYLRHAFCGGRRGIDPSRGVLRVTTLRPGVKFGGNKSTFMTDLRRLFSELIRFEIELWNAIDARLRFEHDLPLTWFEPMQVIARRESCRVNDIAEELVITVGGASKLIDRIEASGLCHRRANPADGRSSIIELTTAGRDLLDDATQTFEDELVNRLRSGVSAQSLRQFSETLTKLRIANNSTNKIENQHHHPGGS